MGKTNISWADNTLNPIVIKYDKDEEFKGYYCTKVSSACANCYAERISRKMFNGPAYKKQNAPELMLRKELLSSLSRKTTHKVWFMCSMTDLFGEFMPVEFTFAVLDAELAAYRQTFLNLTKRTNRLWHTLRAWMAARELKTIPRNMWFGTSAENQYCYNTRWPDLKSVGQHLGASLFLSLEPLHGPISLAKNYNSAPLFVIAGGESDDGDRKARPTNPNDVNYVRQQCQDMGHVFHFKQWGNWLPWVWQYDSDQWKSQRGHKMTSVQFSKYKQQPSFLLDVTLSDLVYQYHKNKYDTGHKLDDHKYRDLPNFGPAEMQTTFF